MKIKNIQQLEIIINNLEKHEKYIGNNKSVVLLHNALLKLFNNIDIILDIYGYKIENIPLDMKQNYNIFISTTYDGLSFNDSLLSEFGIEKKFLEECKNIFV